MGQPGNALKPPLVQTSSRNWQGGQEEEKFDAAKVHTIVNLHDHRKLGSQELKSQVKGIGRRRKSIRVAFKSPGPQIASVGCFYRLVVQHQTYKTFLLIALVKIGSVRQLIRLAHGDG